MSAHTPGPWQIHSDQPGYQCTIVGNIDGPLENGELNYTTVCDVADGRDFHANARLIAAAPDLLNACDQALRSLLADGHEHYREVATLRQAIARATGSAA